MKIGLIILSSHLMAMHSFQMKTIWYLVKFFSEENYANDFLDGRLYLNRLSYFREQEQNCDDGRPDITEAISMWLQPHDIFMSLNVPGIGSVDITPKDLAGPMYFTRTVHDYLYIFCMYAIYTAGFTAKEGRIEYNNEQAPKLKRQIEVDERCLKFGPFAVIVPAVPFLKTVKCQMLNQGYQGKGRLIDYYDDSTFHGEIPEADIPFMKQIRFSYQNEFRIAITPRIIGNCPISINIGSIRNIAAKVESSKLNSLLNIESIKQLFT